MSCEQLWLGALTATSVCALAKLNLSCSSVRLACFAPDGSAVRSAAVATVGNVARLEATGLAPDTAYTCRIEPGDTPARGLTGSFRTAPSGNASFLVAFGGDASNGSNHVVFDAIRALDPLLFIHLGDLHYSNIASNSPALFRAAYDEVLRQPRQAALLRRPSAYIPDDHCYGDNNSSGSSASHDAACRTYRERVPHYPLADSSPTGHMGQTWDIGRVRFIMTDQRSAASANSATDNSSKTMLGSVQKTWLKALLAASPGMLIVWICPRAFGGVATAGADHWGGFTNERAELGAHIALNCPGRVVVLSADAHALAIDDGTNHTYGGAVLPTFQAAPLYRTPDSVIYGGATYSEGWFNANGQFGTMEVTDTGGPSIGVTWRGYDSSGSLLVTHSFAVSL